MHNDCIWEGYRHYTAESIDNRCDSDTCGGRYLFIPGGLANPNHIPGSFAPAKKGALPSGKPWAQTFGFASTGAGLYCNYEQLSYAGGGLWSGIDNQSVCGMSINAAISGFSASVPNRGGGVHGTGVVYGDNIYAVAGSGAPEAQWTVYTKLKCNKQDKFGYYVGPLAWIGNAAFSGISVGTNLGYLSCTLPSKGDGDVLLRGSTIGKLKPQHNAAK